MPGISEWLFKRRIQKRWHMMKVLSGLIIDFWVAVYLVIPALVLFVSTYRDWWQALPAWYLPAYQGLWAAVIAWLVCRGKTRTYLTRADLVLVYPNRSEFARLLTYGQIVSTLLHSLPLILVMVLAYPFVHHVQEVRLTAWLGMGAWVLALKAIVLNINWHLSQRLGKWRLRLTTAIAFVIVLWGWYGLAEPYFSGRSTFFPLLWAVVLAMILAVFLSRRFRINDWDSLMAEEEYLDIDMMPLFLGHGAQVEQQGRSGQVHIVKGRMGIPFQPARVFTYFFLKHLLRKKNLWTQFGQFYLLAAVIGLQNVPFWVKIGFIAAILIALGATLQLFWKEHSQDLFLGMLPLSWEDVKQGIKLVFYLMTLPLVLLVPVASLTGKPTWGSGLAAAISLVLLAVIVSDYLSLKTTILFAHPAD